MSIKKKTKKKGTGKRIGSAFERKVCKELSLWATEFGIARDDLFWRSATSGGRATTRFKQGKKTKSGAGDIIATDVEGMPLTDHFVIECKKYARLKFESLLFPPPSSKTPCLYNFWRQVCRDAKRQDKMPMIIAKQNQYDEIIGLGLSGLNMFDIDKAIRDEKRIWVPKRDLFIMTLKTFFKIAKFDTLKEW